MPKFISNFITLPISFSVYSWSNIQHKPNSEPITIKLTNFLALFMLDFPIWSHCWSTITINHNQLKNSCLVDKCLSHFPDTEYDLNKLGNFIERWDSFFKGTRNSVFLNSERKKRGNESIFFQLYVCFPWTILYRKRIFC